MFGIFPGMKRVSKRITILAQLLAAGNDDRDGVSGLEGKQNRDQRVRTK
jgi:hypothetical protein